MKTNYKCALVTGANRGLGLAFAQELRARGVNKIYAGMRDVTDFVEPGLIPIHLDLNDPNSIITATKLCGDIDLLINNAGIARTASSVLDPAVLADARAMFETNYFGTMQVTQAFVPVLRRQGEAAILNVLSNGSWISSPFLAAYTASKSAEWAFTNALRVELYGSSILVSGMHVGFIDTDLTRGIEAAKLTPKEVVVITLDALAQGKQEILVDDAGREIQASFASENPAYLNVAALR